MTTATPQTAGAAPGAAFGTTLLDADGNPDLVFGGTGSYGLIWTLVNSLSTGGNLVVTPFTSGTVGSEQYHFAFGFAPGALTAAPTLQGWEVAVAPDTGPITTLYVALAGTTPLTIAPQGNSGPIALGYTTAVQQDPGNPQVAVTLTAGANVTLGGTSIQGRQLGPLHLTLVPPQTPPLSAPPLAVDFVGRRTVLNDGQTQNAVTFALTNLTTQPLAVGADTTFTAWFDAAPNGGGDQYWWALATVGDLAADTVQLAPPGPPWKVQKQATAAHLTEAGSPQWQITVAQATALAPQSPALFGFTGIVTALGPGVTRMYLQWSSLPDYADGMLMAELEKSPLAYGPNRGDGMYLSAGVYAGSTPPAPSYGSGLFVQQYGTGPAATLSGGAGLLIQGTQGTAATVNGEVVVCVNDGQAALTLLQSGSGLALDAQGSVTVKGPATVDGPLQVQGGTTLGGTLQVSQRITADTVQVVGGVQAQTLDVAQQAVAQSLQVKRDATVQGPFTAAGGAMLQGQVDIPGPVGMLGGYQPAPAGQSNVAHTDGFVVASAAPPSAGVWVGILQGTVNGEVVAQVYGGTQGGALIPTSPITFPVPAGSTWSVGYKFLMGIFPETMPSISVAWIPFGTKQGL